MRLSGLRSMLEMRRNREAVYHKPEYWDSKAADYEGEAISMWPNENLNFLYNREQLGILDRMLPLVDGVRILDVGCGIGRIARHLASRGAQVLGMDFSASTIEVARRLTSGDSIEYEVESIFSLTQREAFDVAISWGCLTVACKDEAELRNALERIRCALKPGGRLVLLEPIHSGFLHRVLNMNLKQFRAVLEELGFRIDWTGQMHFWPTRMALAFVRWPRMLTATGYHVGQAVMRLLHNRMGDYKAILATSQSVELN